MSILQEKISARLSEVFGRGFEKQEREERGSEIAKEFAKVLNDSQIPTMVTVEIINRVILDLAKKDKLFAKVISEVLAKAFPDIHQQFHFVEIK